MTPSLADLTEAEIEKQLGDARQQLFTLRLQRASGKLESPARMAEVRRTVARLLTELRGRGLAGRRA
jgi:large subunit ribosomal protein L29